MASVENVVSIDVARRAREVLPPPVPGKESLERKIALLAPKYVSSGATLLLLHIAIYLSEAEADLSASFLCAQLRVTPKTLRKYTEELEDNHFLRVRRSRISKRQNEVNQFEIDFNGPLGNQMSALKMPKNQRIEGRVKITSPHLGVGEKLPSNRDIYKRELRLSKDNQRSAPRTAQRFDSVAEAVEQTMARITRKRTEKVEKVVRTRALMLAGVKATWATVMLRTHPTVPPVAFTAKEFAILKNRLQPLVATASLESVFTYFVENWGSLRETKFKWLRAAGKDVAPAPSLSELMRYWKVFAQAYSDSRMVEATGQARVTATRESELEKKLRESEARSARAESEASALKQRLRTAEQVAYAPRRVTPVKDTRTLTQRRASLDARYNSLDDDIPDWK